MARIVPISPLVQRTKYAPNPASYSKKCGDILQLEDKEQIWNYHRPKDSHIHIGRFRDAWNVQLHCRCDWKREDGVTLTFLNGDTLYLD